MKKDIHIKWAVWGGQQAGGDKYMVTDITAQVQNIVDNGGTTVQFDGKAITDPLPGYKKDGLYALVVRTRIVGL